MKFNQTQVRHESRHQSHEGTPPEPDPVEVAPDAKVRKQALDDDFDSVLAEVDGVLEANAEEFVNAFVQKGGQ